MTRLILAACILGIVMMTGCTADVGESDYSENLESASQPVGGFSPSLFSFTVIIRDPGQGDAGGWQQAFATPNFVDTRNGRAWTCPVIVGMPIRTTLLGRISPDFAARTTAAMATASSTLTMHSREMWLGAEFCIAWREAMRIAFREAYPGLGARVSP